VIRQNVHTLEHVWLCENARKSCLNSHLFRVSTSGPYKCKIFQPIPSLELAIALGKKKTNITALFFSFLSGAALFFFLSSKRRKERILKGAWGPFPILFFL